MVRTSFGRTPDSSKTPRVSVLVECPATPTVAVVTGRPVMASSTVPFTVVTGCAAAADPVPDVLLDVLPDRNTLTSTTQTAAISTSTRGTTNTGRRYQRRVRRGGAADGGNPTSIWSAIR